MHPLIHWFSHQVLGAVHKPQVGTASKHQPPSRTDYMLMAACLPALNRLVVLHILDLLFFCLVVSMTTITTNRFISYCDELCWVVHMNPTTLPKTVIFCLHSLLPRLRVTAIAFILAVVSVIISLTLQRDRSIVLGCLAFSMLSSQT